MIASPICICNRHCFFLLKMYVRQDGHILMAFAIRQANHARIGLMHRKHAKRTVQTSSPYGIKKKTFIFSIDWMAPRDGLGLTIWTLRELSSGLIIKQTTSLTGLRTSPMTSTIKIAFTPWEKDIVLCGMMWAAVSAITTPVQKVSGSIRLSLKGQSIFQLQHHWTCLTLFFYFFT